MLIAEDFCVAHYAFVVGTTLPGADHGFFDRAYPHQWRLGMHGFEVMADSQRLAQLRTVVEFQHRHHVMRILARIPFLQHDGRRDAFDFRNVDAFLQQKHAYTPAVRREIPFVELHSIPPRP